MLRMLTRPSRDGTHDGLSAERAQLRGSGSRRKLRAPEMLRLLRLLVIAIATIVCAGAASPAPGITSLAARAGRATADTSSAVRWSAAPRWSHQWRNAAHHAFDLEAVEADLDDDDGDPRCEIAGSAVSCGGVLPARRLGGALRGASQVDTSRFAISTRLARGPPA